MKKKFSRIVSMLLVIAMILTGIPLYALADEGEQTQDTTPTEQDPGGAPEENTPELVKDAINFNLNGADFVTSYTAPTVRPIVALPTEDDMAYPGYVFEGWYDNADFNGDKLTVDAVNAKEDEQLVVFAKWRERYYIGDIPETVNVGKENFQVSLMGDGFYEEDRVDITISSGNEWVFKNDTYGIDYSLFPDESTTAIANEDSLISLYAGEKKNTCAITVNVDEADEGIPSGDYSDTLTFTFKFTETTYDVKFNSNGGSTTEMVKIEGEDTKVEIKEKTYDAGIPLSLLPIAEKENCTFLGWAYDEAGTTFVNSNDRLLSDLELYAIFMEQQPLQRTETVITARANDLETNHIILVVDDSEKLSLEEVEAALTLNDVTGGINGDSFNISESSENHVFAITHTGGWTAGNVYNITVAEDMVGIIYFDGYDKSIDHLDFDIYKEEVNNASLNKNIHYISQNALTDIKIEGSESTTLVQTIMKLDDEQEVETDTIVATFKYNGSDKLKSGSTIGIYEGDVMPDVSSKDSTIKVDNSGVGYYIITSIDEDGTVHIKTADVKDVLFVPDCFPLNRTNPFEAGDTEKTITVQADDLTFSSENPDHQLLGLDEDTTVDIGDFLVFTKETVADKIYCKITGLVAAIGYYEITYQLSSLEEMKASMDVYHEEAVSGDEMLQNTDIPELEKELENQAVESGFTQEVATQLNDTFEACGTYDEFCEQVKDICGAESVELSSEQEIPENAKLINTTEDGGDDDGECPIEIKSVTGDIGFNLKHFNDVSAPDKGVHLDLQIVAEASFDFELQQDDGSTTKITLKIDITLNFTQELCVKSKISAKAEWGVALFIPYIKEVTLSAAVKIYEFTAFGLDIEVSIELEEEGEEEAPWEEAVDQAAAEVQASADIFKQAMEGGYTNLSSVKNLASASGIDTSVIEGNELSAVMSLGERYSAMLNNFNYGTLYKREICTIGYEFLGIVSLGVTFELNVEAAFILCAGINYWYRSGKEYDFTLKLFHKGSETSTTDLITEEQEFNAYIMGALGLKAYVNVFFGVKAFSAKLGLSSDIGAYLEVYGFLYYTKHITDGHVTKNQLMGNMYVELGVFIEVRLEAALTKALSYTPTVYEKKIPLLVLGNKQVVMDFSYTQESIPDVELYGVLSQFSITRNYFRMKYLDMIEGMDPNTNDYFQKEYSSDNFIVTVTNPAFTFDVNTGIISVVDKTSAPVQDGEIIITYKVPEGYMCKEPIQRRYKVHWDNLKDGYAICFDTKGGTLIGSIISKYGKPVTKPANPTRTGYIFAGWYEDEAYTKKYTIPETMPNKDVMVYAKWTPDNAPYTIIRYTQKLDGTYEKYDEKKIMSKTDTIITPEPEEIFGYNSPEAQTETVMYDGSTVIEYYYGLKNINIVFKSGKEIVSMGLYKYSSPLPSPSTFKAGYDLTGWKIDGTDDSEMLSEEQLASVPAEDTVYQAVWTPKTDVAYQVRYYYQNSNDSGNTLAKIVDGEGTAEQIITPEPLTEGEAYGYTLRDNKMPTGEISPDGKTVIRVYYDRLTFDLTVVLNNGEGNQILTCVRQGASVVPDTPYRMGYDFVGWYMDPEFIEPFDYTMPMDNATIYAKWEKGNVVYRVENYLEDAKETGVYTLYETTQVVAKTETETQVQANSYEGYEAVEVGNITPAADSTSVAKIYYNVQKYTLTLNYNKEGYTEPVVSELYFKDEIPTPEDEQFLIFVGWFTDAECTEQFTGRMPGRDLELYAKWTDIGVAVTVVHKRQILDENNVDFVAYETQRVISKDGETCVIPCNEYEGFRATEGEKSIEVGAEPITVEFEYMRNEYLIKYNLYVTDNGNYKITYDWLYYGSHVTRTPIRIGYQFSGWYTDEACTVRYTGEVKTDLELYAAWTPMTVMYKVVHQVQQPDGSYVAVDEDIYYEKSDTVVKPPVRLTYTQVILPEPKKATVKGDGSLIVTYKYDLLSYYVTFEPANGEESTNFCYRYEQNIDYNIDEPFKLGYSFLKWQGTSAEYQEIPNNMPGCDIEFEAQYIPVTYSLVYNLNNNANDEVNPTTYTIESDSFTLVNPTREGYIFMGWQRKDADGKIIKGEELTTDVTVKKGSIGNRYYYAQWAPIYYTITLDPAGGTVTNTTPVYHIDSPSWTLEKPTRVGYTFIGWKLFNKGEANKAETIKQGTQGNYSYTAQWQENTYKIHFYSGNNNNGYGQYKDGISANNEITGDILYTANYNVTANLYKRTGYTFIGWDVTANGKTTRYYCNDYQTLTFSKLTANANDTVNFYAVWKANTYTYRLHPNNGNAVYDVYATYDQSCIQLPYRRFYTFAGWTEMQTDGRLLDNMAFTGSDGELKNYKDRDGYCTQGRIIELYAVYTPRLSSGSSTYYPDDSAKSFSAKKKDYHWLLYSADKSSKNLHLNDVSYNILRNNGYNKKVNVTLTLTINGIGGNLDGGDYMQIYGQVWAYSAIGTYYLVDGGSYQKGWSSVPSGSVTITMNLTNVDMSLLDYFWISIKTDDQDVGGGKSPTFSYTSVSCSVSIST